MCTYIYLDLHAWSFLETYSFNSIRFDNFELLVVRLFIMLACVSCYTTSLLLEILIFFLVMDLRILQVSFENHSILVSQGPKMTIPLGIERLKEAGSPLPVLKLLTPFDNSKGIVLICFEFHHWEIFIAVWTPCVFTDTTYYESQKWEKYRDALVKEICFVIFPVYWQGFH